MTGRRFRKRPGHPHLGHDADQTSPCSGRSWQPNGVAEHLDPRGHAKNTVAIDRTRSALWARKHEAPTARSEGLTAIDIRITPQRLRGLANCYHNMLRQKRSIRDRRPSLSAPNAVVSVAKQGQSDRTSMTTVTALRRSEAAKTLRGPAIVQEGPFANQDP